jgi:hypothetical protein
MRLLSISCLSIALVGGAMSACTLSDDPAMGSNPSAIRDAYLIAHGMAVGYSDQPHADPKVSAELARLDAEAAAAVRGMEGTGSADDSARAVAALTDYAARQTTTEQ